MTTALNPNQLIEMLRGSIAGLIRQERADLTARQLCVFLVCYLENEPQTVRGLAELLNIPRPSVTRILDRLEKGKLLRCKADPSDRRSVLTAHTPAGRIFFQELKQITTAAASPSPEA